LGTFSQYNQGNLPEEKYVIIRNLHTCYLVKSEKETVRIQVSEGEVQAVLGGEKINISKGEKSKSAEKMKFPAAVFFHLGLIRSEAG